MTTAPKLTPAQLRVLRELCIPNAYAQGFNTNKWYLSTNLSTQTRMIRRLISMGLVEIKLGVACAYATPAAHALLAEIDEAGK